MDNAYLIKRNVFDVVKRNSKKVDEEFHKCVLAKLMPHERFLNYLSFAMRRPFSSNPITTDAGNATPDSLSMM